MTAKAPGAVFDAASARRDASATLSWCLCLFKDDALMLLRMAQHTQNYHDRNIPWVFCNCFNSINLPSYRIIDTGYFK